MELVPLAPVGVVPRSEIDLRHQEQYRGDDEDDDDIEVVMPEAVHCTSPVRISSDNTIPLLSTLVNIQREQKTRPKDGYIKRQNLCLEPADAGGNQ